MDRDDYDRNLSEPLRTEGGKVSCLVLVTTLLQQSSLSNSACRCRVHDFLLDSLPCSLCSLHREAGNSKPCDSGPPIDLEFRMRPPSARYARPNNDRSLTGCFTMDMRQLTGCVQASHSTYLIHSLIIT